MRDSFFQTRKRPPADGRFQIVPERFDGIGVPSWRNEQMDVLRHELVRPDGEIVFDAGGGKGVREPASGTDAFQESQAAIR